MSMNLKATVNGKDMDLPQIDSENSYRIFYSDDPKKALIEYLKKQDKTDWFLDEDAYNSLSDKMLVELYTYVVNLSFGKKIRGNRDEQYKKINDFAGAQVYKKENIFKKLIEKLENTNNDEIEFSIV